VEPQAHDVGLSEFVKVRPRLFGIAYRILGSAAEAEDIVQDVWVRWQSTNRSVVLDPPAYLATSTTRLAINLAQSARSRREVYVGPWLPEPVDTSTDPLLGAERGEALEFAVLLLLEKLSPTERAAYVLREAFDYPYRQIAEILQLEEANTRQLVTRARQHITDGRRTPVTSGEQRRLTRIQTNGQSSVLISRDGAIVTMVTIDASAQGIGQILWMMRPSIASHPSRSGRRPN
jgi:RNA polymerase sigma factor (sigma-70 family)